MQYKYNISEPPRRGIKPRCESNPFARCILCAFFVLAAGGLFAQGAAVLRDYVGLINQTYHPDVVAYFEKIKANFEKRGESDAVKGIELFLKGATGSGFIVTDSAGRNYVVTNYHVVAQAYTLSITFERQDGYKRTFEGLKIIAADEERDLALLVLAPGDKAVDRGLSFLGRPAAEGEDVYSAGFPALGPTAVWQFARGMVSNGNVRFPRSYDDETLMGPFIQHTAEVDPGNSGGPLLVARQGVTAGYAVAGINTLSALWRQAANYAVPGPAVQTFVNAGFNPPAPSREKLDERLKSFIDGLGVNRAVYPHIAPYLSSACVGENAEYAMMELLQKAPSTTQRDFIGRFEESVVGAMGYAVAWTIENSIRGGSAIKAAVKEVNGAGEEYAVTFAINGKDYHSTWIREYGIWRIRTFDKVAEGNKALVAEKEKKRHDTEKLRTDSSLAVEAGYAHLDSKGNGLYASLSFFDVVGGRVYYAGQDFYEIEFFIQAEFDIPLGSTALLPYFSGGMGYQYDEAWEKRQKDVMDEIGFPLVFTIQGGMRFMMAAVPGLSIGAGVQYNLFTFNDNDDPLKLTIVAMVGYRY